MKKEIPGIKNWLLVAVAVAASIVVLMGAVAIAFLVPCRGTSVEANESASTERAGAFQEGSAEAYQVQAHLQGNGQATEAQIKAVAKEKESAVAQKKGEEDMLENILAFVVIFVCLLFLLNLAVAGFYLLWQVVSTPVPVSVPVPTPGPVVVPLTPAQERFLAEEDDRRERELSVYRSRMAQLHLDEIVVKVKSLMETNQILTLNLLKMDPALRPIMLELIDAKTRIRLSEAGIGTSIQGALKTVTFENLSKSNPKRNLVAHYQGGGADDIYIVSIRWMLPSEQFQVISKWGKRDERQLSSMVKGEFDTLNAAKQMMNELFQAKLEKGYVNVESPEYHGELIASDMTRHLEKDDQELKVNGDKSAIVVAGSTNEEFVKAEVLTKDSAMVLEEPALEIYG